MTRREGVRARGLAVALVLGLGAGAVATPAAAQEAVSDVIVTGYRTYLAPTATTAAKAPLAVLETPRAISVVTGALLEDQSALTLEDALRNVSGATVGGHFRNVDSFRLRGFSVTRTYLDGLPTVGGLNQKLVGLERVEVVKGPAADLYGQGSLGGLVSLVSKRPQRVDQVQASIKAGSYGFIEPTLDANHAFSEDGAVAGRLFADYRETGTFVDYTEERRLFVAPSFTAEFSPSTKLTLLSRYQRDQARVGVALPARGTVQPNTFGDLQISRYIGFPQAAEGVDASLGGLGWEFSHQLANGMLLRQNSRYERYDRERGVDWYPAILCNSLAAFLLRCTPDRDLLRYPVAIEDQREGLFSDTSLSYEASWGGVRHRLTAGVETSRVDTRSVDQSIDLATPNFTAFAALNLFNPNYSNLPANLQLLPRFERRSDSRQTGLYVRDHVSIGKWGASLGARYDWASLEATGEHKDEAFSPSVGVTYATSATTALYANYSRSFAPQASLFTAAGAPLPPETGENVEVGFKAQGFGGKVSGLVSAYQLDRQNVAVIDSARPNAYLVGGEQRSRGVEMESQWRITSSLMMTASYSYIDARITKDAYLPEGERVASVPRNSGNVWLRHTIEEGRLAGLGFGAGVSAYGDQQVYYANVLTGALERLTLPSYAVVDAAVFYRTGTWALQANVNNVFDRRYFPGAFSDVYVLPGAPLNGRVQISRAF